MYRLWLEVAVRGEQKRGFEAPVGVALLVFLTVVFLSLASLHR